MPSFTLLGPQIIRFPFILTSSYPHEILHNWWGNSVFVDYETRQLVRGADRLHGRPPHPGAARQGRRVPARHAAEVPRLREGRARLPAHRVPLAPQRRHRGRRLRQDADGLPHAAPADRRRRLPQVGRALLPRVPREAASFADVREVDGGGRRAQDLGALLRRLGRAAGRGRPSRSRSPAVRDAPGGGLRRRGHARSRRRAASRSRSTCRSSCRPTGKPVERRSCASTRPSAPFTVAHRRGARWRCTSTRAFDVFRLLDPRETPPSIGQIFGEPRVLAVLPSAAPAAEQRRRTASWSRAGRATATQPEVKLDTEVTELPADRAVWLLGRAQPLRGEAVRVGRRLRRSTTPTLEVDGETMPLAGHSLVLVRRHPQNLEKAIGWIFADGTVAAARPRPQAARTTASTRTSASRATSR